MSRRIEDGQVPTVAAEGGRGGDEANKGAGRSSPAGESTSSLPILCVAGELDEVENHQEEEGLGQLNSSW